MATSIRCSQLDDGPALTAAAAGTPAATNITCISSPSCRECRFNQSLGLVIILCSSWPWINGSTGRRHGSYDESTVPVPAPAPCDQRATGMSTQSFAQSLRFQAQLLFPARNMPQQPFFPPPPRAASFLVRACKTQQSI